MFKINSGGDGHHFTMFSLSTKPLQKSKIFIFKVFIWDGHFLKNQWRRSHVFCYPQELDGRPCHWVSEWLTFWLQKLYSFTALPRRRANIEQLIEFSSLLLVDDIGIDQLNWALVDDIGIDYLDFSTTITNNQTLPSQVAVAGESICSSWFL